MEWRDGRKWTGKWTNSTMVTAEGSWLSTANTVEDGNVSTADPASTTTTPSTATTTTTTTTDATEEESSA